MEELCFYLLGFPRMERGGKAVTVDTRKATALLALLAVNGEPISRDSLSTMLWPEYDQTGARAALRRTLSVLNKAVGSGVLDIERERVGLLKGGPIWLDVQHFEDGLQRAAAQEQSGDAGFVETLAASIALAKDRFMAGFSLRDSTEFDDWQYFHAERLARELGSALDHLVAGYAGRGQYETAIGYARQLLALDPLREEAHRQLMLLYARSNQRSTALRQYRDCVRILDEELGVAPLEETTALYQTILENRLPAQPEVAPQNAEPPAMPEEPAAREAAPAFPLVGREAEWEAIQVVYGQARDGGRVLVLEGEAGIGKTRLANEFLDWAQQQGARVLRLRWYEGEAGLAYGPFTQALERLMTWPDAATLPQKTGNAPLAEAARLLPEIASRFPSLPEPPPLDGPGAQSRFYEGLRQVFFTALANGQPGVLFLDDMQWADRASQDLLAYLIRRIGYSRVMVMITLRSDAAPERSLPQNILHEAGRYGILTRVELDRLATEDVRRLAQSISSHEQLPSGLVESLFRESEGLPFFAVAYLDALRKGPAGEHQWEMPASVRELLMSRLHSVDETARQLLSTAAVIGRSFDLWTLREVSGRSEMEAVTGLEHLLSAGLVSEHAGDPGSETYDFTHEKLRDLAYEETSAARRKLLHRRVAEVISSRAGRRDPGSQAAVVAYHHRMAGNSAAAAVLYREAGDYSRSLYANAEAIEQYQAALASGLPDKAGLREAIGDLLTLQGEYSASIASYEAAAALCSEDQIAILERKLGNVHARLGDWDLAESHYQRAVESGLRDEAGIFAERSHAAFQRGDPALARVLAQHSLLLAQSSGDPLALAQAHNVLGMFERAQGNAEAALGHLQESLTTAEKSGNPLAQAAAFNNLSLALMDLRRLDEAEAYNRQALAISVQVGDRHREAALLNNQADIHHAAGRELQSLEALKRAVLIFAEIGVDGAEMKPEIWKLTAW